MTIEEAKVIVLAKYKTASMRQSANGKACQIVYGPIMKPKPLTGWCSSEESAWEKAAAKVKPTKKAKAKK